MMFRVQFVGDVGFSWVRWHRQISDADCLRLLSAQVGESFEVHFNGIERPATVERIS